jgi:2-polyprenyl-3-methyl-5-hydroxy-6-metoxy-1,4-benzoquinol methylase
MPCGCGDFRNAAERQFSQKRATKDLAQYRAKGPGPTTRLLLAGLATAGPLHGGLLDIGSGVGVLSFELLDRGVTSAVGVDLSSAHVAIAAQEASRRGRSESTRFLQGDFLDIAATLPSADIVTLDRVVCCYPEYQRFLQESLRHAGRVFAFSYPLDRWYIRTWVGLQNGGRAVRRNAFRSFVHRVSAMEDVIRREGFRLLDRRSTRTWRADVYARS